MTRGTWNNLEQSAAVRYTVLALGAAVALLALAVAMITGEVVLCVPAALSAVAWMVITVLTLQIGGAKGVRHRIGRLLMLQILWSLALEFLFFLMIWGIAQDADDVLGPVVFWLPVVVLLLILAGVLNRARRRRIGDLVLSHVAKALELNLPLPAMIAAAAQSERGALRRRLWALHDRLDSGETVWGAVADGVPEVPVRTIAALAAAEKIGRLRENLPRWIRTRPPEQGDTAWRFYLVYPLIVALVLVVVAIGIGPFFMLPKMADVLRGFNMPMPLSTRLMREIPRDQVLLPLILLGLGLIPLGRYATILTTAASVNPPMGGWLTDRLKWWTPGFHGYERDRGVAELCRTILQNIESGRPMPELLFEAAEAQGNVVMRKRVKAWAERLQRGEGIAEAARRAGMPRLLAGMIAAAPNDQTMAQALGFLARHYEWRLDRTRQILIAAYVPAVCCVMGLAVGFVELSVMQPIAELIRLLSAASGGH